MYEEKWIEEVWNSMEGSKRARPSQDLFAEIEKQIQIEAVPMVQMTQWRWAAAAAILLLLLNTVALQHFTQTNTRSADNGSSGSIYEQQLISDYNLYD